jgi:hypothetical protein
MEEELQNLLKQKLYSFVALFMAFVILMICLLVRNKETPIDPVEKYFAEQKKTIESQTILLEKKIDSLYLKISENNEKLEVITKTKTQIKYVYISDIKKIDALNTNGIIKNFDTFFSKSNSK